jgi:hypothetical protein
MILVFAGDTVNLRFEGGRWDGHRDSAVFAGHQAILWVWTCPKDDTCVVCNCEMPDNHPQGNHFFSDKLTDADREKLGGEWWLYNYDRTESDGTLVYVADKGEAPDYSKGIERELQLA